jgi:hypothetical protein
VQERSADVSAHCRELEWPLANARERSIDIAEESFGETSSFVLVPPRGILEIGLGERPNDEPAHHAMSATAVELLPKASLYDLPAVTGVRIGFEIPLALVGCRGANLELESSEESSCIGATMVGALPTCTHPTFRLAKALEIARKSLRLKRWRLGL